MPINIPNNLPAYAVLNNENIFVMTDTAASHQDIRPLRIAIVNLMPKKIETETQILRLLSNTPLQVDIELIQMASHVTKNTPIEHLTKFYKTFDDVKDLRFDGLIITGAPVEQIPFEDVDYWKELCEIMEWSKTNAYSTWHICWGAQAGLYYHYGVPKYSLPTKMFGVFPHRILCENVPLFSDFEEDFYVPHSRHTEIRRNDIIAEKRIALLSESDESGVYIMTERGTRDFFVTGHSEYALYTLDSEYRRDVAKGLPISPPRNYYLNDDPQQPPVNRWSEHAIRLFNNWLDCYLKK